MTRLAFLPDLEPTITALVVELLLLEKARDPRYRGLLLDNPTNDRCVRMTMHYVMALLAYGFLPDSDHMQELARWFDRPFPKQENDHIDPAEMNRLMALLRLRPHNDNVQTRLHQLVLQKVDGGYDVQPSWHGFDTLWTLEIFKLAHDRGVLGAEIATLGEMERLLDELLAGELRRDKDIALALRLRHDLFGSLRPEHEAHLERLIGTVQANHGVWGLEELGWRLNDMDWLRKYSARNKITAEEVRPFQEQFRRVILSTCMVIEELAPLIPHYPQLQTPIDDAMCLWWQQFHGPRAVEIVRDLFPRDRTYDYVLVLARTMRALRAYLDKPLCTLDTVQVHILRELAQARYDPNDPPDVHNIKLALRHWIRIDLIDEIEPLKLGFSEANIVRVHPHIWSPMVNDPYAHNSLINQSLIIKYGPQELIRLERENYAKIPAATRDCFVRIPEASYTDPHTGRTYVIMQDLRSYKTLYEVHEDPGFHLDHLADPLWSFLWRMHEGGSSEPSPVSPSLLREIYLRKTLEHIDRIFDFLWDTGLYENADEAHALQNDLFRQLGDLIHRQGEIEPFPAAYMHGDLHLRNIMVSGYEHSDSRLNGPTFKLIDLEYFQAAGDAAFDAGELLIDILLVSEEEDNFENRSQLTRLYDTLEQKYIKAAHNREDDRFANRMELAKARALLRIAKGKTKRGYRYFQARQSAQAAKIAREVQDHARHALKLLTSAGQELR